MVGSVSQVGAEKSIKGSENHPDKNRQRVIQDSIVVDGAGNSAGKLAVIGLGTRERDKLVCLYQDQAYQGATTENDKRKDAKHIGTRIGTKVHRGVVLAMR